jgi:hypothetical protein
MNEGQGNIYTSGDSDARQGDERVQTSRFRPRYRKLTDAEIALHDAIKEKAAELETLFSRVGNGRYQALAYTSLEESVMWIVKQLTL